ncbi:MAG: acyl-CoA dehydrogenase [Zoogloeaceae bacterium]|nr:acyl-CoA dehydrogenase [Zoogloeaceae bacterium]
MVWTLLLALLAGCVFALWHDATRRRLLSDPAFRAFRGAMPSMSQTERDALEAGTVWWEGELFSGRPDWQRLLDIPWPKVSDEEQAFLDGETDELCRMIDDWNFTRRLDMSPEVWEFIRRKGFFSLIIPKEYGGKGFSAFAHSQVVTKLASRSSAPAVSVMVPNSLGPAELLIHYGTEAQKQYWLPRLAAGDEVPAFALTSPWAGSDAASIPDAGVVCRGEWQGQEVLGMRVSFDKRYITLAPVCTVFGLAFRLYDPEHLLGGTEDLGITVALVPREHPGVEIGRRHLPLDAIWMNGPIRGQDVFMPLDFIIGGPERAGQGWRMLMECLAAGRSISLPAANSGTQKLTARAVGAYARVRRQFRTPIGRFEGVEEALARIAANTWLCGAARVFTAGALDLGERPSVVSAIVKYHVTERARQTLNDGMDVIGGKGICLGPQNFLGRSYQQLPIGITVEGANILTRSLILYGQGAIRCHPHLRAEMDAVAADDGDAFHSAFSAHLRDLGLNALRALGMGLTGSHFVRVPEQVAPHTRRYYQQLSRLSAAFAVVSDACLASLGGALKRREKLSARLGDILSLLFLMSACLRRYEAEGQQAADTPLLRAAMWDAMFRTQIAFEGVLANLPNRPLAWVLARIVFPLGRPYVVASDRIGAEAAATLLEPSATRERLTQPIFVSDDGDDPLAALEAALEASIAAEPVEAKVAQAMRKKGFEPGALTSGKVDEIWQKAFEAGFIDAAEHALIERRNRLRDKVIRVDDFPVDFDLRASLCER